MKLIWVSLPLSLLQDTTSGKVVLVSESSREIFISVRIIRQETSFGIAQWQTKFTCHTHTHTHAGGGSRRWLVAAGLCHWDHSLCSLGPWLRISSKQLLLVSKLVQSSCHPSPSYKRLRAVNNCLYCSENHSSCLVERQIYSPDTEGRWLVCAFFFWIRGPVASHEALCQTKGTCDLSAAHCRVEGKCTAGLKMGWFAYSAFLLPHRPYC